MSEVLPHVDGVEHRSVEVGEIRLHVAEAGDGPPLLLLHGWPQHWWCWRHLMPPLAERYRVIAPDLRGWGWSDAPPGSYEKTTFVADIIGLLDAEGLEQVPIIGHDWGGFTAYLLGLEHPERVQRILALDIAPPWLSTVSPRLLALPVLSAYAVLVGTPFVGPRTMTTSNAFIRSVIRGGSSRGVWSDEDLDVFATVLRDPARAAASSACYRTFLTRELAALARRNYRPEDLGVETLLLGGSGSPLHRVLNPQPAGALRVETIQGAGHFLPEEAPAEVLDHARRFLTAS